MLPENYAGRKLNSFQMSDIFAYTYFCISVLPAHFFPFHFSFLLCLIKQSHSITKAKRKPSSIEMTRISKRKFDLFIHEDFVAQSSGINYRLIKNQGCSKREADTGYNQFMGHLSTES